MESEVTTTDIPPSSKPYSFLHKSIRVIAVDDNPLVLDFYRDALELSGLYHVECFTSAEDAFKRLFVKRNFHFGLLDLGMEDVNKDEYFLLKVFGRTIPWYIITGSDSTDVSLN